MSRQGIAALTRRGRDAEALRKVARRVRDLRLALAVTQEELATAIGVKRESMSRYENGERAITIPLLIDIAAALGQPVTALLPEAATEGGQPDEIAQVTAILQERPDLLPSVLDLLTVLHEDTQEVPGNTP